MLFSEGCILVNIARGETYGYEIPAVLEANSWSIKKERTCSRNIRNVQTVGINIPQNRKSYILTAKTGAKIKYLYVLSSGF
jgi:hypothetical protein